MPAPDPAGPPRVFLDGYNLALPEGTGVATYGHNLARAQRRLGYRVGVLYGTRAGRARDKLLREVLFFDEPPAAQGARPGHQPPGAGPAPRDSDWVWAWRHARRLLLAPGGDAAQSIPLTAALLRGGLREMLPDCDEVWNARDLFTFARTHFDLFRARRLVRVDGSPALMHWTYPLPLRLHGARNLTTLHDLVPLRLPSTTLDDKRRYLRLARLLAARADHIVTVSEASRRDIIALLGVPAERVTNTYQSAELPPALLALTHAEAAGEVAAAGLRSGDYLLFVGAIEPKKNVARMIDAYRASGVTTPLVLAGKLAWRADEQLRAHADDPRIRLLGHQPQRRVVALMRCARALLLPSVYEGFGLPALEAMQLGTPVITANTASMPEIVGDAALTVDPYDVGALAAAIRAIDQDPALRGRLAAAGLARAELFSAARYAARLGALYTRLGVPPPDRRPAP